jgi:hypothetical protein
MPCCADSMVFVLQHTKCCCRRLLCGDVSYHLLMPACLSPQRTLRGALIYCVCARAVVPIAVVIFILLHIPLCWGVYILVKRWKKKEVRDTHPSVFDASLSSS